MQHLKFLVSMFIAVFCVSSYASTKPPHPQISDPKQSIVVQKSQPVFVIRLASNPTTGYSWFIKNYDKKVILLVSQKYYPPQKMMPGAGGYQEFKFRVNDKAFTTPVSTKVQLDYKRPWEKTSAKDVNFKITFKK